MIQPSADQINVHVFISGKVQGVGYRFSTAQQAKKRAINGWVKNLPDGRVEAVFEGSQPVIEEMLNWCAKGPTMANVVNIEVKKEATKSFQDFQVID